MAGGVSSWARAVMLPGVAAMGWKEAGRTWRSRTIVPEATVAARLAAEVAGPDAVAVLAPAGAGVPKVAAATGRPRDAVEDTGCEPVAACLVQPGVAATGRFAGSVPVAPVRIPSDKVKLPAQIFFMEVSPFEAAARSA
jgi:hypothetical protein